MAEIETKKIYLHLQVQVFQNEKHCTIGSPRAKCPSIFGEAFKKDDFHI
jgi:hypothetical protein